MNLAENGPPRGHRGVIFSEPDLSSSYETAQEPIEPVRVAPNASARPFSETFEGLYVALAPELMRFATMLVGPSQAEDLLGSTVAKAIASTRWDRVDNKRAYLYRMLINEAHKSRRGSQRRLGREIRVVHRDAIELEQGIDPDVLTALKRLSVRQRAVIHLTYWADLAPQQVADTIGTSLRTVERELTNARTRLKATLS